MYLSPAQLTAALTLRDLSDPAHGPHAMQALLADVVQALCSAWVIPAAWHRTPALVSVEDNYDRLGFSADDVTRDRRYSRYASETVMLRSHTSAGIPPLLRGLDSEQWPDALHVLPGLVYRRDGIDRTHVGEPHQVDLWRIGPRDKLDAAGLGPAGRAGNAGAAAAMEAMVASVVNAVLPGARWRTVASAHPYTQGGRQVDVWVDGAWLELAECGPVAPRLLAQAGLSPNAYGGLALGMGLDRALMLRKGIDDIRLLRSTDERVASQMLDLGRYRPVSHQPAIARDLSVVVDEQVTDEAIGDTVREALGERAGDLESVVLLARTPAAELPPAARERLRVREGQVNALLRVVIRPLERTLTSAEANALRDEVYLAVHEGPVKELIA
ncbi:PheS-related mystery ligase SrmL [Galactobacter valiniphilus]|uniref:PheS-related mystery ligase SrmL n=1 Tax=Galactobacter valiniphilus TaxID=2676122 RepID=UPI003736EA8B